MLYEGLSAKLTRVRPTSNIMFSAAAIAVVSEVNPDHPGASFFPSLIQYMLRGLLLVLTFLSPSPLLAGPGGHTINAVNSAIYNNQLVDLTPMLFHHLELGMSYESVANIVGKSALYCDSGETYCNADNGTISASCLEEEFIHDNKNWVCHWDGRSPNARINSRLDVWFVGARVNQVSATLDNGSVYFRDSSNTVHLEQH